MPMPLDHSAWKIMHRHYLVALRTQTPKLRRLLAEEVGDTLPAFQQAVKDQLFIISAQLRPDGLYYVCSVRVSDGVAPLARVHAKRLGMDDPQTLLDEARWAHLQKLAEEPAPDDASELTDD